MAVDATSVSFTIQFYFWEKKLCVITHGHVTFPTKNMIGLCLSSDAITLACPELSVHRVRPLWLFFGLQIMYRPLRDLNGIEGAERLIVCLTGYQRQDRDDIMVYPVHFSFS